jgi:hypothetical protein
MIFNEVKYLSNIVAWKKRHRGRSFKSLGKIDLSDLLVRGMKERCQFMNWSFVMFCISDKFVSPPSWCPETSVCFNQNASTARPYPLKTSRNHASTTGVAG